MRKFERKKQAKIESIKNGSETTNFVVIEFLKKFDRMLFEKLEIECFWS